MDSSEAGLDSIEVQRPTDVSHDQRKQRHRGELDATPSTGDTESIPDYLTNLRLSDLYNLPGEYVLMNPKIFSAMRAGNEKFLEKMKNYYRTPVACFKNNKGDSILHLAAAFGHLELVKTIVSECPCLLLEPNSKDQLPLHVTARAGHLTVVEALVATVTFFSAKLTGEEERERLSIYVLKDINGDTPLHLALKNLHEKTEALKHQHRFRNKLPLHSIIIKWLCSRCTSFPDASTRLMETAACLVQANQRASFLANKDGMSPLYLAVEAGNVSIVKAMLNCPEGRTSNLVSLLEGKKSLVHAALKGKNTGLVPT